MAEKSSFSRVNIDNSLAIVSISKQKSEIFISWKIQPELISGSLGSVLINFLWRPMKRS